MKNSIFLLLVVLLYTCDKPEKINREYRIENGTNYSLKIDFYEYATLKRTNNIAGTGLVSSATQSEFEGRREITALNAFRADSVVITFNTNKRQIYYYDRTDNSFKSVPSLNSRNVLNDAVYSIDNIEIYRFTLLDEDYTKAQDI